MRDKSGWLSWWVIATLVLSLLGGAVRPAQAAEIISDFSGSIHAPSGTPVIDGVVDAVYGTVIATDAPADSQGGAPVDLSNLWVTQDASYFYFAFEVNTNLSANNWGKYALYIDTTGDAAGATTDAWGRSVVVSDPHKPEYGIYTWVDNPPYNPAHTNLVHWTGSSWDWGNATTIDEALLARVQLPLLSGRLPNRNLAIHRRCGWKCGAPAVAAATMLRIRSTIPLKIGRQPIGAARQR